MIPKIWCWLFGHDRRAKDYTGYAPEVDHFGRPVRYYKWYYYTNCPCCGTKLEK